MFENWRAETTQQRAKRGEVLSIEIKTKKIESLRQSQAILISRVTLSVVQNKASNDGRTETSQERVLRATRGVEDKYRYYCIYTIFVVASQHTGNGRMKDFQLLG